MGTHSPRCGSNSRSVIREMADAGKPTVVGAPDSRAMDIYRMIARRVAVKVDERAKDMSARFPNIVVQNT